MTGSFDWGGGGEPEGICWLVCFVRGLVLLLVVAFVPLVCICGERWPLGLSERPPPSQWVVNQYEDPSAWEGAHRLGSSGKDRQSAHSYESRQKTWS